MSNLVADLATFYIRDYDEELDAQFDRKDSALLSFEDKQSSETTYIHKADFQDFVQKFLYHYNRFSSASKSDEITEVKIDLQNSPRNCFMSFRENSCIFPKNSTVSTGRDYEVRICFENMFELIRSLNTII